MNRSTRSLALAVALAAMATAFAAAQRTALPTPQSVIGWEPCADYKLATYEQIEDYFRKLAAAAPARMQIVDMGRTSEGRTQILAVISSEENIRQLGKHKAIVRSLALGRDGGSPLTDDAARALAHDGKAVVWIDFGLHSIEVAHGQTAPLLAFKAVTDESEEMRFIRDNVILLLVANMNPDGTTMVASWYRENLGKPWESRLPELWHKYVGHDDNRDWYMMNQVETRNSARQLYTEWFPQIIYNQHQTGPFPSRIFVPPFDDPMNPNIPPLVMRGVNAVGDASGLRRESVSEDLSEHHDSDARADDVLSEPVHRRRVASSKQLRLHGDGIDGRPRCRREAAHRVALRRLSDGARRNHEERERDVSRASRSMGSRYRSQDDQRAPARRSRCRAGHRSVFRGR